MSEISTQKILDGITLALHNEWPESHVYADEVEQGLESGDFNVILITSSQEQIVGERYKRIPFFDVLYYPKKGREECYSVADALIFVLKEVILPGGDLIRGTDINFEITDNVLHFYVRYTHFIFIGDEKETMDSFRLTQGG